MNNKSFTLIELLVVIVIIGILAGVIMISTSSSIDKANIAKLKVFDESVANDLAANMVSRWKFDQINYPTANQTPDAWGSNTGTLYGAQLQTSECVTDNCFLFDGIDDYIDLGTDASLNITNQITISAWVNPVTSGHTGYQIVSKKTNWQDFNGYDLMIYPTNAQFYWGDNSGYAGGVITTPIPYDGKWKHITGIITGNVWKLYVNGVFINSLSHARYFSQGNSNHLYISREGGYCLKGMIDDVKIYDSALSSSQIKQNYIAGLSSLLSKGSILKEDYNQRINELAYNEYE